MIRAATALIGLLLSAEFGSETIDVKGRGAVDLSPFECRDINRSSFIQRVCYDQAKRYLIIGIKGVYDQYCELPQPAFDGLMGAPSMGQFFNQHIGGSGAEGRYGCRPHPIPGVSHRQDRADGFLTALVSCRITQSEAGPPTQDASHSLTSEAIVVSSALSSASLRRNRTK